MTLRTKCQVFLDVAILALSVFQPSSHVTSQIGYFVLRLDAQSQLSLGSLGCLTRSITWDTSLHVLFLCNYYRK